MAEHKQPRPDSRLPAGLGIGAHVCAPPYSELPTLSIVGGRTEPPLGSVVYATGGSVLAVLELLAGAIEKWPWVAPCAGLPPTETLAPRYAALRRPFDVRLAVVHVDPARPITPTAVARAVAARPCPVGDNMAGWIADRADAPHLAAPLVEQFAYALGERSDLPRSVSWYSRAFSAQLRLTARDWRAVARLVQALHRHGVRNRMPHRTMHDPDPQLSLRTTRCHSMKYLGRTWSSVTSCVGWEWILECVMRKHLPATRAAPRRRV